MKYLGINNKKGFTLVEILVVVAIIGILTSLIVVAVNYARERAKEKKVLTFAAQIDHLLKAECAAIVDFNVAIDVEGCGGLEVLFSNVSLEGNGVDGKSTANFNGTDGGMVVRGMPDLGDDWAVQVWINPAVLSVRYIVRQLEGEIGIFVNDNRGVSVNLGAETLVVSTDNVVEIGKWTHVVFVHEGGDSPDARNRLIVNTVMAAAEGTIPDAPGSNYDWLIGVNPPGENGFGGLIDNVAWYKEALPSSVGADGPPDPPVSSSAP